MIRRIVLTILIILLSINGVLAEVNSINKAKQLKVKLKGQKKFKAYLLCFGKNGFVTWDSTLDYNVDDIDKYASYHYYQELKYLELGASISLYPMAIGGIFILSQVVQEDENSENGHNLIMTSALIGLGSLFFTFLSMFIPRRYLPANESQLKKFPNEYIMFKNDIPDKLAEFLMEHDQ